MKEFTTEEQLRERIKELSCLNTISVILLKDGPIGETLEQICFALKEAWLHPDDAVVELILDEHRFHTATIGNAVSQEAELVIFNDVRGTIKVQYDAAKFSNADFLDDELRLLRIVASEISSYYEKHLHNERIQILKRSAERTDRLSILGEITAGIAHELNTPLGNILGYAELIRERSTDRQSREDSAKVVKAAIYSREIVKKLMFFSCEMPQHIESVEIGPIVDQTLRLLEPNFKNAGISFLLRIKNAELKAQVDNIQFTQVLFNIVMNSIYFSPKGSTITIDITNDSDWLYINIADQGVGIPDDKKDKVFEPFFTSKPAGDGTGLGLSVVHGIVKSHKGFISTADNDPTGTVFKIQLPIKHQ